MCCFPHALFKDAQRLFPELDDGLLRRFPRLPSLLVVELFSAPLDNMLNPILASPPVPHGDVAETCSPLSYKLDLNFSDPSIIPNRLQVG